MPRRCRALIAARRHGPDVDAWADEYRGLGWDVGIVEGDQAAPEAITAWAAAACFAADPGDMVAVIVFGGVVPAEVAAIVGAHPQIRTFLATLT